MPFLYDPTYGATSVSNLTFGKLIGMKALDDAGKFWCAYNEYNAPQDFVYLICTIDTLGNMTRGVELVVGTGSQTFQWTQAELLDGDLVIGGSIYSWSGTGASAALTLEATTNNAGQTAGAHPSWDATNLRALSFYSINGGTNKLLVQASTLSSRVITNGTIVAWPGSEVWEVYASVNCGAYHPTTGKHVLLFSATKDSTQGIWAVTAEVDASRNLSNQSAPVLVFPFTFGNLIQDVYIEYNAVLDKMVASCQFNGTGGGGFIALLDVPAGGVVTVDDSYAPSVTSGDHFFRAGHHPVTGEIFYYAEAGNRFASGKWTGTEIRWGQEVDVFPASSTQYDEWQFWSHDASLNMMAMGMTNASGNDPQLIPFRWAETQFIDLPALDASGGLRPPVNVDITFPAFQMYTGNLVQVTIDSEFMTLDVQDFSLTTEIIPYLYGELAALEGGMNGGASLGGDLAALEGSMTLYNETTAYLDAALPALTGSMTGYVTKVLTINGEFAPLDGQMYGGAQLYGELAPLEGSGRMAAVAIGNIYGELPALSGTMEGTFNRGAVLEGELAPLDVTFGHILGDLPALTGSIDLGKTVASKDTAWVVNKTNGAITRYPDYDFDYVVRFNGRQLLVKDNGLYEFDRSEDIPEMIDARFALPPSDYGTSDEKRCPRVYMQGMLDGWMRIGINYDEKDEIVQMSQGTPGVNYWRTKMGRGPKGHHVQIAVENADGSDFEIEKMDALITAMGRKI